MQIANFKNIVVGVDYSDFSQIVFRQAKALAKKFGAKLHLVYVSEEPVYLGTNIYSAAFRYTPPSTKDVLKSVNKTYGIKASSGVKVVVKEGSVTDELLAVAETLASPLLVIGSVGRGAVSSFMMGTHAEQIALKSPHPVWVHRGSEVRNLKKILVPVDFSEASQSVVGLLQKARAILKVQIDYFFVQELVYPLMDYKAYKEIGLELKIKIREIIANFESKNPGAELKHVKGEVAAEIVRAAKHYDVVVMSPHNRKGLFKRFGRVTSKVLRLSGLPVLIIPNAKG